MSSLYSGSLQRKTKADLQEISLALGLSDAGTKDDIHQRIKRHLEENVDELETDPVFSGLYTRKRRIGSLQPTFTNTNGYTTTNQFDAVQEESEKERDISPPTAVEGGKSLLNVDARDVSMMLPHAAASPSPSTTVRSSPRVGRRVSPGPSVTNSPVISTAFSQQYLQQQQQQQQQQQLIQHLAGLLSAPTSPAPPAVPPASAAPAPPSPAKSIIAEALEQPEVREAVEMQRTFIGNALATYALVRTVCSFPCIFPEKPCLFCCCRSSQVVETSLCSRGSLMPSLSYLVYITAGSARSHLSRYRRVSSLSRTGQCQQLFCLLSSATLSPSRRRLPRPP